MKLIRYGPPGLEKPGVLVEDDVRLDASEIARDFDGTFFAEGGLDALADWLESSSGSATRISPDVRLGPPIANPGKLVCIGLNYRDHARETGAKEPAEPVLFFKATSAIVGPNDDLMIPKNSSKTDWEVELAVAIGKRATHVSVDRATEFVAGYALHNDYSEREFQLERGGQWVKGKSCDTFAPIGPFLATRDEIQDVQRLPMWLSVNGESMQSGTTADMIFGVAELVSYVSRFMTLHAGDIISTGTPAGVGLGMKPQRYLSPGDIVELGIEGLGSSRQQCTAFRQEP